MGITNFPNGISSFGMPVYPSGLMGLGMARGEGRVDERGGIDTKVIFVDTANSRGNGSGNSWKNSKSTIQDAVNLARYDYTAYAAGSPGSSDINYDDERQCFVFVAPDNYAEQVLYSAKNVHLFGMGVPGGDSGVTIEPSAPAEYGFAFSGTGSEIVNFYFKFAGVTGTLRYGCYFVPFEAGRFHDNVIETDSSVYKALVLASTAVKGTFVERNIIFGDYTTHGIYVPTASGAYFRAGKIDHNHLDSSSCTTAIEMVDGVTCNAASISHNKIGNGFTNSIVVGASGAAHVLNCDNWVNTADSGGISRDEHSS